MGRPWAPSGGFVRPGSWLPRRERRCAPAPGRRPAGRRFPGQGGGRPRPPADPQLHRAAARRTAAPHSGKRSRAPRLQRPREGLEPSLSPPSCRSRARGRSPQMDTSCPGEYNRGPAWNRLPQGCSVLLLPSGARPTFSFGILLHVRKVCSPNRAGPEGRGPREGARGKGRPDGQQDCRAHRPSGLFASGIQPQACEQGPLARVIPGSALSPARSTDLEPLLKHSPRLQEPPETGSRPQKQVLG